MAPGGVRYGFIRKLGRIAGVDGGQASVASFVAPSDIRKAAAARDPP
jgi:hypothetical protein